jgi:hypothetical protein
VSPSEILEDLRTLISLSFAARADLIIHYMKTVEELLYHYVRNTSRVFFSKASVKIVLKTSSPTRNLK